MDESQDIYSAMGEFLSVMRALCMAVVFATGIGVAFLLAVVLL